MDKASVEIKYSNLKNILRELGRMAVAFSGGTDSTLLLRVAREVLGDNVLAITALSETTSRSEQEGALCLARDMGVTHLLAKTCEMEIPEFVKNPRNKCYICKKSRFGMLIELAAEKEFFHVADGENRDDEKDYRPGSLAAEELGVRSPLREAGLGKSEIRALSRELGIPTWDKPAYACLASRIPYHSVITPEKLRQIDEGEEFLRELGLNPQLRLRHHGDLARIECNPEDIPKLAESILRKRVSEYFEKLGFSFTALDLGGYHMGNLNK